MKKHILFVNHFRQIALNLGILCLVLCSIQSCKEDTFSTTTDLKIFEEQKLSFRSTSADTTYLFGSSYSISYPNAYTTQITLSGEHEWMDNVGGTTWNYINNGTIDVICDCVRHGGEGGNCEYDSVMNSGTLKVTCKSGNCHGHCEVKIKINSVINVGNAITVRPKI